MPVCKGCQEIIKFVEMESGMRMPVNSKPVSIVVVDDQTGKGEIVRGFMSHFATCPNADKFRKGKKKQLTGFIGE